MTREPIGTTRIGQVVLGMAGLVLAAGSGAGLLVQPDVFEPLLRAALVAANWWLHWPRYDPSQRHFYAGLLIAFGAEWVALSAYAFLRQPAEDSAIDAYLTRDGIIEPRVATIDPTHDPRS